MRAALIAAPLLLLAGCATGPSRSQVLASLVGHSEADAMRTLGAPNQIYTAGGSRFLAYVDGGVSYVPAAPYGPWGFGYYYFPASVPVPRTCEMTLEVTGGKVVSWRLRGDC